MEEWWPPWLSNLQSLGGCCWASRGRDLRRSRWGAGTYGEAGVRCELRGKLSQPATKRLRGNQQGGLTRRSVEGRLLKAAQRGRGGRFSVAKFPGLVSEVAGHRPPAPTQACMSTQREGRHYKGWVSTCVLRWSGNYLSAHSSAGRASASSTCGRRRWPVSLFAENKNDVYDSNCNYGRLQAVCFQVFCFFSRRNEDCSYNPMVVRHFHFFTYWTRC